MAGHWDQEVSQVGDVLFYYNGHGANGEICLFNRYNMVSMAMSILYMCVVGPTLSRSLCQYATSRVESMSMIITVQASSWTVS